MVKTFKVYTDGNILDKPGVNPNLVPSVWAYTIYSEETREKIKVEGALHGATKNQMKLFSIIQALNDLKEQYGTALRLFIYTDSDYVTDPYKIGNEKWIQSYRKNDFLFSKKGYPIKNTNLLKELDTLLLSFDYAIFETMPSVENRIAMNKNERFMKELEERIQEKLIRTPIDYDHNYSFPNAQFDVYVGKTLKEELDALFFEHVTHLFSDFKILSASDSDVSYNVNLFTLEDTRNTTLLELNEELEYRLEDVLLTDEKNKTFKDYLQSIVTEDPAVFEFTMNPGEYESVKQAVEKERLEELTLTITLPLVKENPDAKKIVVIQLRVHA